MLRTSLCTGYRNTAIRFAVLALTALVGVFAARSTPAHADEWCWNDPTLIVNGRILHIDLGVQRNQVSTVTDSTLVVTVPAGVTATLSGLNATNFVTRLRIDVELVYDPTLTYSGIGPVPVQAVASITAPSTTQTGLKIWAPGSGVLGQTTATGGRSMSLSVTIP